MLVNFISKPISSSVIIITTNTFWSITCTLDHMFVFYAPTDLNTFNPHTTWGITNSINFISKIKILWLEKWSSLLSHTARKNGVKICLNSLIPKPVPWMPNGEYNPYLSKILELNKMEDMKSIL